MIPYLAVHTDYNPISREIAHKIKGETISGEPCTPTERSIAIDIAARDMALLIPKSAILVPMPSHHGYATDTLILANKIASIKHCVVKDILKGASRLSSYEAKKQGVSTDFGFYLTEEPQGVIYYVDNIVASGATAKAAYETHKGIILTYAITAGNLKGFTKARGLMDRQSAFVQKRGIARSIV